MHLVIILPFLPLVSSTSLTTLPSLRISPIQNYLFKNFFPVLLIGTALIVACDDSAKPAKPETLFDVGIYTGDGAFSQSVKACFAVVRFAGFTCDTLRLEEIADSKLQRFAVILFPGGDAHLYSDLVGPVGRGYIRSYVADGGGYIGFGAGGAFAASDSGNWPGIGIISGTTRYPSERVFPNPHYGMIEIERTPSPGIVARGLRYQTLYRGGPEFFPANSSAFTVDYQYYGLGSAAVISGEYGYGHFWVSGFQPEFEEGNPRDGTTFGDDLADVDSEWELIQAALDNCVTYANRTTKWQ